ncbi:MAG: peptidylprolyl isomerase, partial [Agrobacterium sp.]|nr:peptidylprolyl isomerase [Agrobacterium sp.]
MKLVRFAFAGAMFAGALAASTIASAAELLTVQLKDGPVVIELMPEVAPKHVAQIEALAKKG